MEPEMERPEMRPMPAEHATSIPMPGHGERAPMPAGPGTERRSAGDKNASSLGIIAAAILTAGLASAIVFRGTPLQAPTVVPAQPAVVEVVAAAPAHKAAPAPAALIQTPSEVPSFGTPGGPAVAAIPAANSHPSPLPFFSLDESQTAPDFSGLQPYDGAPSASPRKTTTGPAIPAANTALTRPQPEPGLSRTPAAAGATAGQVPCSSCEKAVAASKPDPSLKGGGETFVQREITIDYAGVCDGKYVYDYENVTANRTITMVVRTTEGESWPFTLKPGQKISLKSSVPFTPDNYESIRVREVMN